MSATPPRWNEVVARLEALLVEERAAIRRLDGGRVLELATEKERLMEALRQAQPPSASPSPPSPPSPSAVLVRGRAPGQPLPSAARGPVPKPAGAAPKLAAQEQKLAAARMRRLGDELRRNAVLLAHARDCIRDAVAGAGVALPALPGRQAGPVPGRRISVTG